MSPESGISNKLEQTGQKFALTIEFDCANQPFALDMVYLEKVCVLKM